MSNTGCAGVHSKATPILAVEQEIWRKLGDDMCQLNEMCEVEAVSLSPSEHALDFGV